MSNPNQVCFLPEPGDTNSFGSSVAISDQYLAIGDPKANHVIIYTRDDSGTWKRTKKIFPPEGSTPYKYGRGFGINLQLDKDVLATGAFTQQRTSDVTNPEDFQPITTHYTPYVLTFEGRYLVRLDSEEEPEEIAPIIEKESGLVQFNLLSEGKIKQITLSDREEKRFGNSVALHKNLLLIGSPPTDREGRAWLFDINNLDNEPLELTAPNVLVGESVAISGQFAAAGSNKGGGLIRNNRLVLQNDRPIITKTLIRNLQNGSTTVIDGVGKLSIDGNILARMRPRSRDGYLDYLLPLLEVFRLDEKAVPYLITKRRDVNRAWVHNGFLITAQSDYDAKNFKVCIESIS